MANNSAPADIEDEIGQTGSGPPEPSIPQKKKRPIAWQNITPGKDKALSEVIVDGRKVAEFFAIGSDNHSQAGYGHIAVSSGSKVTINGEGLGIYGSAAINYKNGEQNVKNFKVSKPGTEITFDIPDLDKFLSLDDLIFLELPSTTEGASVAMVPRLIFKPGEDKEETDEEKKKSSEAGKEQEGGELASGKDALIGPGIIVNAALEGAAGVVSALGPGEDKRKLLKENIEKVVKSGNKAALQKIISEVLKNGQAEELKTFLRQSKDGYANEWVKQALRAVDKAQFEKISKAEGKVGQDLDRVAGRPENFGGQGANKSAAAKGGLGELSANARIAPAQDKGGALSAPGPILASPFGVGAAASSAGAELRLGGAGPTSPNMSGSATTETEAKISGQATFAGSSSEGLSSVAAETKITGQAGQQSQSAVNAEARASAFSKGSGQQTISEQAKGRPEPAGKSTAASAATISRAGTLPTDTLGADTAVTRAFGMQKLAEKPEAPKVSGVQSQEQISADIKSSPLKMPTAPPAGTILVQTSGTLGVAGPAGKNSAVSGGRAGLTGAGPGQRHPSSRTSDRQGMELQGRAEGKTSVAKAEASAAAGKAPADGQGGAEPVAKQSRAIKPQPGGLRVVSKAEVGFEAKSKVNLGAEQHRQKGAEAGGKIGSSIIGGLGTVDSASAKPSAEQQPAGLALNGAGLRPEATGFGPRPGAAPLENFKKRDAEMRRVLDRQPPGAGISGGPGPAPVGGRGGLGAPGKQPPLDMARLGAAADQQAVGAQAGAEQELGGQEGKPQQSANLAGSGAAGGGGAGQSKTQKAQDQAPREEPVAQPLPPATSAVEDVAAKSLEPLIKVANQALNKYLLSVSAIVWGSAFLYFPLVLGAIVGDLLWLFKKPLLRSILKTTPLAMASGSVRRAADKVADKVKIGLMVKINIFAFNLLALAVPILLVVIFMLVACNTTVGKRAIAGLAANGAISTISGVITGNSVICDAFDVSKASSFGGGDSGGAGASDSWDQPGGVCQAPASGAAAPQNISAINGCFGGAANKAAAIANAESGGDASSQSKTDICTVDGSVVSFGLFQINISANSVGGLNCPSAFNHPYTGSAKDCQVTNQALYNQCKAAALDPAQNIAAACRISSNGSTWSAWGTNRICQF